MHLSHDVGLQAIVYSTRRLRVRFYIANDYIGIELMGIAGELPLNRLNNVEVRQ